MYVYWIRHSDFIYLCIIIEKTPQYMLKITNYVWILLFLSFPLSNLYKC